MRPLLVALTTVLLVGSAAAQDRCPTCDGAGLVPCTRHGDPTLEDGVLWCSAVGACRTCVGAGVVDCPRCDAEVGAELARRVRRAAERRRHDQLELGDLADQTVTVELDRVRLTIGATRTFVVDGRSLDAHELAHHCARVVASVRADFVATFGISEDDFPVADSRTTSDPHRLMAGAPSRHLRLVLVRDAALAGRAAPRFTGLDLQGLGVLRLGANPAACVHLDREAVRDAVALRRLCAYLAARMLLAQVVGSPGEGGHGWIESGVAHLFEARFGDSLNTFAGFGEVVRRPPSSYRGGDWHDAAQRLAEQGRLRPFAMLAALQHEELDLEAHAQARALVEFLLQQGGGAPLLRAIREVLGGGDPVAVFSAAYPAADRTLDQRLAGWLEGR